MVLFIAAKQLTIRYTVQLLDVTGDEFQNMQYVRSAVWNPWGIESRFEDVTGDEFALKVHAQRSFAQRMPIQNLAQFLPRVFHVLMLLITKQEIVFLWVEELKFFHAYSCESKYLEPWCQQTHAHTYQNNHYFQCIQLRCNLNNQCFQHLKCFPHLHRQNLPHLLHFLTLHRQWNNRSQFLNGH